MKIWRFFLTVDGEETEIREPENWAQISLSLRRSTEMLGLEMEFANSLTFLDNGAEIIYNTYQEFGISKSIGVRILSCFDAANYEGEINWEIYRDALYPCYKSVEAGITQTGFRKNLKSRFDLNVDLNASTSVDGTDLFDFEEQTFRLHSRELKFAAKYNVNKELDRASFGRVVVNEDNSAKTFKYLPPFLVTGSDFPGSRSSEGFETPDGLSGYFYSDFTYPQGITNRRLNMSYYLDFKTWYTNEQTCPFSSHHWEGGIVALDLYVRKVTDNTTVSYKRLQEQYHFANAKPHPDDPFQNPDTAPRTIWQGTEDIDLPADCIWYFEIVFSGDGDTDYGCSNIIVHAVIFNPDSCKLEYTENSVYPGSELQGLKIHESLDKLVEILTGQPNSMKSEYFGRTDTQGRTYSSNGEGSWAVLTNGLGIRGMKNGANTPYPISVTFKKLAEGLDRIHNLGIAFEREGTKDIVRIEPKTYFYNRTVRYTIPRIKGIRRLFSVENVYNEVEVGYSRWETQNVNGLQAINTKHTYSLNSGINKSKKLNLVSEICTEGTVIETTRRYQFKSNPTTDNPTDNDLFLISLNRIEVTTDKYTGVSATFQPATVSERNESFLLVMEVIGPDSVYNLRLSPSRNLIRHLPFIGISLTRNPSQIVKFMTGLGNILEWDKLNGEEDYIYQNQDHTVQSRLYDFENLQFQADLTLSQFLYIASNSRFSVIVSETESDYYGSSVREVTYNPNRSGGIATFKSDSYGPEEE
jgi:hypothetical protein